LRGKCFDKGSWHHQKGFDKESSLHKISYFRLVALLDKEDFDEILQKIK
jgi:hypothetical protein